MSQGKAPERSKEYSAVKTRLFAADLLLSLISLAVFQVFLSRPVADIASGVSANFYVSCLIYGGVLLIFLYAVSLPLSFTGSFAVEHRFGLSSQTFPAWLADEAKSAGLSFMLSMGCIEVFYLILRVFPVWWWAVSAAAWVFFTVVLARFMPVLLIPIFFKYLPIEDESLKERIMDLAKRSGIGLTDVCRIDLSRKTKKANAALVGMGGTRKVILADTLTDEFGEDEVLAVVAHEFGHHRFGHIRRLIGYSAAVTFAGFFLLSRAAGAIVSVTGAEGISDLYLLPALVLLAAVFGFFLLPVQNLFSRILERQADAFALERTADADTFISVMNKLAEMNMSETAPSTLKKIFMYNHPPIGERIRMAEEYKIRGGEEPGAGSIDPQIVRAED